MAVPRPVPALRGPGDVDGGKQQRGTCVAGRDRVIAPLDPPWQRGLGPRRIDGSGQGARVGQPACDVDGHVLRPRARYRRGGGPGGCSGRHACGYPGTKHGQVSPWHVSQVTSPQVNWHVPPSQVPSQVTPAQVPSQVSPAQVPSQVAPSQVAQVAGQVAPSHVPPSQVAPAQVKSQVSPRHVAQVPSHVAHVPRQVSSAQVPKHVSHVP